MEKNGLGLETELRLGLPGGGNEKKRVFSDMCGEEGKKSEVVGWPPVRTIGRKNSGMKMYVKVSVDGAPFLRKIDLSNHKGYGDLVLALEQLFGCFGIGEALNDDAENCEYVPIYEDKDGDWMLLGDVPWEVMQEAEDHEEIRCKASSKRPSKGTCQRRLERFRKDISVILLHLVMVILSYINFLN